MPPTTTKPKSTTRLLPPAKGATVRMYRTGHGDCFLLAFAGETKDKPVYVLIDCGYKPGSPAFINTNIKDITDNLRAATGGLIDVAIITHEHQDHVNGITEKNFTGIKIRETWLAWTEDPEDELANSLRKTYKDKLLGLLAARNRLAADGEDERVKTIDEFLAFELGGTGEAFNAAEASALMGADAGAAGGSMNKKSMKVFKDRASEGVKYLRPHESIRSIPGAKGLRIFALGPPRNVDLLENPDPVGQEEFHGMKLDTAATGSSFGAAVTGRVQAPFASRYCVTMANAFSDFQDGHFFANHYGSAGGVSSSPTGSNEIPGNPDWRRIDREWLYSAEQLALDLNDYTNNASLVLAFELGKGGKVLLFAADAQRGNWISWGLKDWTDGDKKISTRDLLARTVLYKVGHHGSHNATLNGTMADSYPNLGWMATGEHAREFTAMITAVRKWAETQKGWDHPLKAIKDALLSKTSGRVFQTDTDVDKMNMPGSGSAAEWKAFLAKTQSDRLYFDYTITG